jgi:hypothetical protein
MQASTSTVAASPCFPPIRRASFWCAGYSVTARIVDHAISATKGEKIR